MLPFRRNNLPSNHDIELLEHQYRGETPLKTFLYLYKGDWHNLLLAVLFFVIKHSGVWAMPFITAQIIDQIADPESASLSTIAFYIGILVVIFAQNIPVNYLFTIRLSTATRNMETKLRAAMSRRLQYLSMSFYHRNSTGTIHTKLLRDVEILQDLTMQLSQVLPGAGVTLIFALIVTAIRVPEFLIFFAVTVPVASIIIRLMQNRLQKSNRAFRKEVEYMSAGFSDMIHLIPVTRAHGIEDVELNRVQERLWGVRRAGMKLDTINALFGATAWVAFRLFEVACLAAASYAAYTQIFPITVGDVVMLTGFFTNLTASVLAITTMIPLISRGFESISSIGEVLQSPDIEENANKQPVSSVKGHFRFENVGFAFEDTDDSLINDFTLEILPGETIAFVGPSGAGKSTLLNLIIGFIRPSTGKIYLDGVDMNQLDLRTYRKFLSVVPQEVVLFEGTLRDNVLYGVRNIDDNRLKEILRLADLEVLLSDLPDGLDTYLGENGARLSGGQKQRIAVARALIRNPRVLILDEATSALDTVTETQVQAAINHLRQGRTTFIVAHRLTTVRDADRIVVLDKGRIVEAGTHNTLMASEGQYASLYQAFTHN